MQQPLPENAFLRESQQLIRRLSLSGGYVLKAGAIWSVYSRRNDFRRAVATAEDRLVTAMLARGLLAGRPGGGLMLTAASGNGQDLRPAHMLVDPGGAPSAPAINRTENPLAWLRSRKDGKGRPLIGDEQFMAGERLRADYERARLERRITSSWELPIDSGAGGGSISDNRIAALTANALAARQNVNRALQAVGPELAGILVEVCCLAAGIEQAERLLNLPQRSGKAVLTLALTSLARHYGMLKGKVGGVRPAALHWAMEDYRPTMAAAESS
ncbi:MAG: DUF6456 domain-containing protein [Hyphomicrobiales bacterium]